MTYRAIVLGATGAVGSRLVGALLASPKCAGVVTLGRRTSDALAQHANAAKLTQRVVDLDTGLEESAREAAAGCAVAFCTLGIGQPRKVSEAEFRKVDLGYARAFASGARAAGVEHFAHLSSVDANPRARARYLRVKGEVEDAITALGFPRTSLFRPSLLITPEARYGLQDHLLRVVFPLTSWAMPRRYHQIHVDDLARAFVLDAEVEGAPAGVQVLQYREFCDLLHGRRSVRSSRRRSP